jgi:hypothetical protein
MRKESCASCSAFVLLVAIPFLQEGREQDGSQHQESHSFCGADDSNFERLQCLGAEYRAN